MLNKSNNLKTLRKGGWFSNRSTAFQRDLLECGIAKDFEASEALYHYGDTVNGIFAVLEGGVQITVPADDGQEFVIHREGAGFWVGDLALFADSSRLVSVVATQSTRALFFPNSRVTKLVQEKPDYVRDFYALSHENMQTALRIVANLVVTGTEKRLALRLLHLDEGTSKSDGWIEVSQEELAEMIAVSQPTLHRSLHRLADLGLVEVGYGRVLLKDRRGLIANCQN
ncbi:MULTISPECIES: Crp/Fnr family transcriptional regulator [unclassified Ruegeria]|uniref:Crp/Fnr family transcriptional regulator n=1 Tax=unclassified Ruegeria TaxID=2625375 RepID=UPI00148923EF|nr:MULTISPECIES: Crp/Fnr family transcriptional regulator [unclassified Ruegeria]